MKDEGINLLKTYLAALLYSFSICLCLQVSST